MSINHRQISRHRNTPAVRHIVIAMPRPPRLIFAGQCYHVLNRANRRAEVFHEPADYSAFISLMAKGAGARRAADPARPASCRITSTWLFARTSDNDIARWMQWLFTTHVRHYHEKYGTTGHVWQGRYKSFLSSGRPLPADAAALRRAKCVAREARVARRRLEMGKPALATRRESLRLLSTPPPLELPAWWTRVRESTADRRGTRCGSNERQSPTSVRRSGMGGAKSPRSWASSNHSVSVGRPRKSRSGPIC